MQSLPATATWWDARCGRISGWVVVIEDLDDNPFD